MNFLIYIAVAAAILNLMVITGILAIATRDWHLTENWEERLLFITLGCYLFGLMFHFFIPDVWATYVSIVLYSCTIVAGGVSILYPAEVK